MFDRSGSEWLPVDNEMKMEFIRKDPTKGWKDSVKEVKNKS